MNLVRAIPTVTGFEEALRHFAEEGVLVDVFLRTYPMGFDIPEQVLKQTRGIRNIPVCL